MEKAEIVRFALLAPDRKSLAVFFETRICAYRLPRNTLITSVASESFEIGEFESDSLHFIACSPSSICRYRFDSLLKVMEVETKDVHYSSLALFERLGKVLLIKKGEKADFFSLSNFAMLGSEPNLTSVRLCSKSKKSDVLFFFTIHKMIGAYCALNGYFKIARNLNLILSNIYVSSNDDLMICLGEWSIHVLHLPSFKKILTIDKFLWDRDTDSYMPLNSRSEKDRIFIRKSRDAFAKRVVIENVSLRQALDIGFAIGPVRMSHMFNRKLMFDWSVKGLM